MYKKTLRVKFNICRFENKTKEQVIEYHKRKVKQQIEQMKNLKIMNKQLSARVEHLEKVLYSNDIDRYCIYKELFKQY